jgi:biopolymer transport protein TolQ
VAPSIAEALLATAAGLFVAIPAVIFYNYITDIADNLNNRIENLIVEFTDITNSGL